MRLVGAGRDEGPASTIVASSLTASALKEALAMIEGDTFFCLGGEGYGGVSTCRTGVSGVFI